MSVESQRLCHHQTLTDMFSLKLIKSPSPTNQQIKFKLPKIKQFLEKNQNRIFGNLSVSKRNNFRRRNDTVLSDIMQKNSKLCFKD